MNALARPAAIVNYRPVLSSEKIWDPLKEIGKK
jgi:hypothetical protein